MNLDASQREKVTKWIEAGLTLSEIQGRLASELGVRMTYMEVRFLLDDLKLRPKDKERPPATVGTLSATGAAPAASAPQAPVAAEAEGGAGNVSVTVDQIARPGALVSGKVTFSDGNAADWHLDQLGRLGLAAKQQGYRPSEEDLLAFQTELQAQLAKLGF